MVDIIALSKDTQALIGIEHIVVSTSLIALLVPVAAVESTELPISHINTGNDVDGLGGLSVVYAGKLRLIALLVENLDFIHDFCR